MTQVKGTILIVDDEERIRVPLGKKLEREGYSVFVAGCEDEALRLIRDRSINVVLLDLHLTKEQQWEGIKVLEEAIRIKPSLQIIIITAYGEIEKVIETIRKGAYDFLEKPIDTERLLLTVRRALERDVLFADIEALKNMAFEKYKMIGASPAMNSVYELIEKTAPTNAKILITGESGVGKELVAGAIHQLSQRATKPFLKVNCSAIPTDLIESELFGIGEGVASGVHGRIGKFEQAQGGTIFLDEIGDMSASTQTKVLRVLDKGDFYTVGGTEEINVDVRVIAATSKDLEREIEKGTFREDLYYRLNEIVIDVPPLRERRDDIPLLLDHYVRLFCEENNHVVKTFTPDALTFLKNYEWNGNVRRLRSLILRLVLLAESDIIGRQQVLDALNNAPVREQVPRIETLREARERFERDYIHYVLEYCNWNMNKSAEMLSIDRVHLFRKMKKYGLERDTDDG
jgi:two-component system nitrogen regulation response regulator NtrX